MERNGNDRVEMAFAQALVVERRNESARNEMAQMNLSAVFEIEDNVPNDSAAAIDRNSGVEIERAMRAIGAGERLCDCAIKWLGTFCAKRRHDSRHFCFTFGAKIFANLERRRANRARWGIKQRREAVEEVRCCERPHISTSRALAATSSRRPRAGQFQREDFCRARGER